MDRQTKRFITKFAEEVAEHNAAIFAGAGLSAGAGFVDWKSLLSPLAEEIGLKIDEESDLISLAQYHVNEKAGNRHAVNERLVAEFSRTAKRTENHQILARLPIQTFWTTNYDRLIEESLKETGKIADVKYTIKQLAITKPKRDAVVYKMHGDVEHPDDVVLTKDDYESYYSHRSLFVEALSGDLISKTFLFIGFSFTDPNLDYILSRIRVKLDKSQREHFCIFRRRQKLPGESDERHSYETLRQDLFIKDLKRFNITAILVDQYEDITQILKHIESIFKQKTVLISGSAHEYGEFENPEAFITSLSHSLIKNGNKIVSGFGLGVGSHVIMGVLNEVYHTEGKVLQDQLILRPFPQGGADIVAKWQSYREDMLGYAGASIFLFGNKLDSSNGNTVVANGVKTEFELAKAMGHKLIPVGVTGYAAREIWDTMNENFDDYFPGADANTKELFNSLAVENNHVRIINNIITLINIKG